MKKHALIFLLFVLPIIGISQLRVMVGPSVGYQNSWLLNPNMIIVGDQEPEPTFNVTNAIEADVRILKWLSFHTGFGSSKIAQDFVVTDENESDLNANHTLKTSNIPLTLRLGTGFYLETGFTHTSVKSATWTFNGSETNVSNEFAKSNWMVTGGFGGDVVLADKLMLNLGIRTNYGMKDLMGVDAFGRNYDDMNYFLDLYDSGVDITEIPGHEDYLEILENLESFKEDFDDLAKTYSLTIGAYVGLKWVF